MRESIDLSSNELIWKLHSISKIGWIESTGGGPQGVGDTLEHHLGLPRTNKRTSDWGIFELKASRLKSRSPITIVTQNPEFLVKGDIGHLIRKYGYCFLHPE